MSEIVLRVEQLPEASDLPAPAYMTEQASGLDLRAAVESEVPLAPGEFATIPTGIRISLPLGQEGQVRPRSGLAARHGVTIVNAPGTIDADYRGELQVVLANCSREPYTIERGTRFAQLVINKVEQVEVVEAEKLTETARSGGGFGHTGN